MSLKGDRIECDSCRKVIDSSASCATFDLAKYHICWKCFMDPTVDLNKVLNGKKNQTSEEARPDTD